MNNVSIEDSLLYRGKEAIINKELVRYATLRKEFERCTFQPIIHKTKSLFYHEFKKNSDFY